MSLKNFHQKRLIVRQNFVLWFEIKLKNSAVDGAKSFHSMIGCVLSFINRNVNKIAVTTLKRNALSGHYENTLLMIMSDDDQWWALGVLKIAAAISLVLY